MDVVAAEPDPLTDGRETSVRFVALPPATRTAWTLQSLLVGAAASGAAVLVAALAAHSARSPVWPLLAAGAALIATAAETVVLVPRRHASYRYGHSADAVVITQGILLRRRIVVPRRHIVLVELRQGFLLRRFGLVAVRLGTVGPAVEVGPVAVAEAAELRRRVEADDS